MNRAVTRCGIFLLLLVGTGTAAAADTAPNLNGGTWQPVNPAQSLKTLQGQTPPLLPAALAIYQQHLAAAAAGDKSWDGTQRCLAPGLPRLLYLQPSGFEFLQRPEQIVITYVWNHMVRTIDMNVSQHDVSGPTYEGQSIGRWEGRTLVVDSIGFNDTTVLDSAGLPHSDALHVVERYTSSADGRRMTVRIRIEDPKTFSAPWETALEFKHDAEATIDEDVCLDRLGIKWEARKKGT